MQRQEYDHLLKITLIGDASVGKSSLLLRYIDDIFDENYICTIGVDFKIKTLDIEDKQVKLQIWDTAGQERFKPITNCYFRGSNGALIVFDITNRESLSNVDSWVRDYRDHNDSSSKHSLVLVGNKADQDDKRVVSQQEAEEMAERLRCVYIETSAKTGHNLDFVFQQLTQTILKNTEISGNRSSFHPLGIPLENNKTPEAPKKKCCS